MIDFNDVTITYDSETGRANSPAISNANIHIAEGELALLVGRTGSGKSTLLGAINGLVPHFTGGLLQGQVVVAGRDTRTHPPRELADVVGFVQQDPMSGFVTDTVEEELAYGMEALGVAPQTMRRRVEDILDLLGLAQIRDRSLLTLSGGERQRTAIGSVLAANPAVLVLDEPTSALDPGAAEEVLAAIQRLVFDLGLTVLMAEHRLERVVQYADQVVVINADGTVSVGPPATELATAPVAPPVVEFGRRLHLDPLPLSVRDARRETARWRNQMIDREAAPRLPARDSDVVADIANATVLYGSFAAVRGVSAAIRGGEIVALMGRNGAGKSTLLNALVGIRRPDIGTVRVGDDLADPAALSGRNLTERVGLVPQESGDLLYCETVHDECASADHESQVPGGTTRALLERFAPGIPDDRHPRDLSEGQRLCLVMAVVMASKPSLLLLDEPTRGLDYPGKASFTTVLKELAASGHAILMATHDVELVAATVDRVLIIADGELVADGPTENVVISSPMFAPQISKIMRPVPFLRVDDAVAAVEGVMAGDTQ